MNEEKTQNMTAYSPSDKDKSLIQRVYNEFEGMRDLRNRQWEYFNGRNLKEFIDDSELRFNGYVPTREEQGKEPWQANVFHPTTRNKAEAILAAVALDVPPIQMQAFNEKGMRDAKRAYVMRHLVKGSFNNDNKEEQIYFEGLECMVKGTVITSDMYMKTVVKRKIIKSVDIVTGEVEYDEEEVVVDNQCIDFIVPVENMYISDFFIKDIQKQPALCWVELMNEEAFELEFGKNARFKFVKPGHAEFTKEEAERFFKSSWVDRVDGKEPIEVIRYFNKFKDEYIVIANGVLMLNLPMLWGKRIKKYPFAKTIYKPFAADFFYGNSLPNSMMGEQDVINSLFNMALDRSYKSMVSPLLVGNANKDNFDLEDSVITNDTKIYVQDINQVKELKVQGITDADVKMMDIVARGLDMSSVDANQQGTVREGGVTAREVVIANENAIKLKGVFYMFLTSLWIQKTKLRALNILTYYTLPLVEKTIGDGGGENTLDQWRKFMIDGAELSTGDTGTLGVQMVGNKQQLPNPNELDINEEMYKQQNNVKNYEEIAITSDYLDDWEFDVKVTSDSMHQKDSSVTQAKMEDKMKFLVTFFPEVVANPNNKKKLFDDVITSYDDDPDSYELVAPAPPAMPGMEGAPVEGAAPTGQPPVPGMPA